MNSQRALVYLVFAMTLFMLAMSSPHANSQSASPIFQIQQSSLDGGLYEQFGTAVAIYSNTIVIGAPGQANSNGEACIYQQEDQVWQLSTCLSAIPTFASNVQQFGDAVSISENYIIVGATQNNSNSTGAAYIFSYQNNAWIQDAELLNPDSVTNGTFGETVSISGEYAAVGSQGLGASRDGAVYIFKRDDTGWAFDTTISPDAGENNRRFGSSVALSGEYLIIGNYEHGRYREGSATIYKRDDDIWSRQARLKGGTITRNGEFGFATAISENYAVVGAQMENDPDNNKTKKRGAAYVYRREGTQWHHQTKLLASDGVKGDQFGSAVTVSGNHIIVGAKKKDSSSGSSYIFENIEGSWSELEIINASDRSSQDNFGNAVALSDNNFVIGADSKPMPNNLSGVSYTYDLNINTEPTLSEITLESTLIALNSASITAGYTDSDDDGLSDINETSLGTDPMVADTDSDGLTDKEEVAIYQTDPLVIDSDSDGLTDFEEAVIYNSDPLVMDTDNDGYSDYVEVNELNTNPALIDSDSDGFTDQEEINLTNTNPTLADTDGDGLSDNEEINIYNTEPNEADSDGDGFSDGNEVNYYATDPLIASDAPGTPTTSTSFSPASGEQGTMAFEDEWPIIGDYDFNDAVFNYNIEESKIDGLVKYFVYRLLPTARGAIYDNSLRLLINTPISNIESSTIKTLGQTSPLPAIADGNKTLFILIDKIEDALPPPPGFKLSNTLSGSPKVNGNLHTITITFRSPIDPLVMGAPPYNSFISRVLDNGELLEVHFPGRFPTSKASKRKFGLHDDDSDSTQDRYYQTESNLPWAMIMPSQWHHTKERVDLSNAYPDILTWAATRGKKNKTWYKSKRNSKFVFDDVPDI